MRIPKLKQLSILTMTFLFSGGITSSIAEIEQGHKDALPIGKGVNEDPYYLFLGASGASITDSDPSYQYSGSGCMHMISDQEPQGDFDLDLQIPDGHQIISFRYYFYDGDQSASSAQLYKFNGQGGSTPIDQAVSTGNSGYGNVLNTLGGTLNHIVDNSTGYYVLRFQAFAAGTSQRMCGVRFYIDPTPGG